MSRIKISGPVSVRSFDLGDSKRLILFGDEHFSYEGLCKPCKRPTCLQVAEFIRESAKQSESSGSDLDVFLEMPYVPKHGVPDRERILRFWDRLFKSNSGPGSLRDGLRGLIGAPSAAYVGVISELYKEFSGELYDDSRKAQRQRKSGNHGIRRFHYADARSEPNVELLLPKDAMMSRVQNTGQLVALLNAFIFDTDFVRGISNALGTDAAAEVSRSTLSSTGAHKVATQFHRIPDGSPVKAALRAYLIDRIKGVEKIMLDDVSLDNKSRYLAILETPGDRYHDVKNSKPAESWLVQLQRLNQEVFMAAFSLATRFAVHVLIMDAYLISRLTRFALQQKPGSLSIVYVGDGHAVHYVEFLERYLKVDAVSEDGFLINRRTKYKNSKNDKRCVTL